MKPRNPRAWPMRRLRPISCSSWASPRQRPVSSRTSLLTRNRGESAAAPRSAAATWEARSSRSPTQRASSQIRPASRRGFGACRRHRPADSGNGPSTATRPPANHPDLQAAARGADPRAVAETEWHNHQKQIENAKQVEAFLNAEGAAQQGKTSNQAFYTWMKREVKGLYARNFQFAFDAAKRAERALQHELGDLDLSYLQFGYLSGKEGLLAGEKLWFDLKRMEVAYQDLNHREFELTKHVSLAQVDPLALVRLRRTGGCTVTLPEALFDLDGPGHYFRRIRNVAVSIPASPGRMSASTAL